MINDVVRLPLSCEETDNNVILLLLLCHVHLISCVALICNTSHLLSVFGAQS